MGRPFDKQKPRRGLQARVVECYHTEYWPDTAFDAAAVWGNLGGEKGCADTAEAQLQKAWKDYEKQYDHHPAQFVHYNNQRRKKAMIGAKGDIKIVGFL